MPYINNGDLDILIKIEHLIGCNQDKLFTQGGEKHYFTDKDGKKRLDYQEKVNPETGVSTDDFNTYWNFVERVIQDRKKANEIANKWNKEHPERHREINRESAKRVAKKSKR